MRIAIPKEIFEHVLLSSYQNSPLPASSPALVLVYFDRRGFLFCPHDLMLEQESAFFFNMKYFEEKVHAGEWEEVEKYLSGFTKVDDIRYSMKILFEIKKQKYLEALDRTKQRQLRFL
ncbi:RNA polymerase II associated Paf1 complex subunit Tpr1 [Orobanche hederae]